MRAVIATDLSDAMDTAIESRVCLECLARYGIDAIDLITVTSPNVTTGMPGSDVGSQTKRALERQQRTLEAEGFDVDVHVVRGTPHRRINGLAERVHADLVIAGSRGQSPLQERFIGGTARDLVRTTVRPLLLERIRRETPSEHESAGDHGADDVEYEVAHEHLFRRVLYATDFSENAERAFEQFRNLKHATQEATLLHVTPPDRREDADAIADAEARLEALADELREKGIDEVTTIVRSGETTAEILAAEQEVEPTTVLVGSRGRSRIRRLLVGSTTEAIARRSNCNVLVVPPAGTR
ncbi:universal stress protein [Halorubellus salinus]|uniref:universal stress protein n=1 Tax=Halorubellus salinus TaxID=755309 RepID=UPI001D094FB0|nr:universal stress protein [Halorubellus salinus]